MFYVVVRTMFQHLAKQIHTPYLLVLVCNFFSNYLIAQTYIVLEIYWLSLKIHLCMPQPFKTL